METSPSPLSSRPERSAVEGSAVQQTYLGKVLRPKQKCHPDRSGGTCCSHPTSQISMKASPSPLSSRPKRSAVEGSAVQQTYLGKVLRPKQKCHPDRSGGTCCSPSHIAKLNESI